MNGGRYCPYFGRGDSLVDGKEITKTKHVYYVTPTPRLILLRDHKRTVFYYICGDSGKSHQKRWLKGGFEGG